MKKLNLCLLLLMALSLRSPASKPMNELDRVFVYLNSKLVGTWRADEEQVVHIDKIADGDTLTFRARTDLGGLGNSSIDVKDDTGIPIENIQSPSSSEGEATFIYVFHSAKIDFNKAMSLQVFLNMDPTRNLPPPTVATIFLTKK
jgi:hypothetical protein